LFTEAWRRHGTADSRRRAPRGISICARASSLLMAFSLDSFCITAFFSHSRLHYDFLRCRVSQLLNDFIFMKLVARYRSQFYAFADEFSATLFIAFIDFSQSDFRLHYTPFLRAAGIFFI
jgi:hypothetical protein